MFLRTRRDSEFTWENWWLEQKLRVVLAIFALFFISMVMSCQELRYMVSGKVADAPASARQETMVDRYGQKQLHQILTYSYQDGTDNRGQSIDVPLTWSGIQNGMVKVQYIPGRDTSRLLGQTNRVWVCVFFGSLVLAVIGGWLLVKFG